MSIINDTLKSIEEKKRKESEKNQAPGRFREKNDSSLNNTLEEKSRKRLWGTFIITAIIVGGITWKVVNHNAPEVVTSHLVASAEKNLHHIRPAKAYPAQSVVHNKSATFKISSISKNTAPSNAIKNQESNEANHLMQDLSSATRSHDHARFDALVKTLSSRPHWRRELGLMISQLKASEQSATAELLVQALQKRAPMDAPLRMQLAHLYLDDHKSKTAASLLEGETLSVDKHTAYYALLAYALMKSKKYEKSIGLYQQLISIDSSQPTWWMGLGVAYLYLGKSHEALASFERAQAHTGAHAPYRYFLSEQIHALRGGQT